MTPIRQARAPYLTLLIAGLVAYTLAPVSSRTQTTTPSAAQIDGAQLPPYSVALTFDDGPDEDKQIVKVAEYLSERRIYVTFFLVGCHFTGEPPPDARSSICVGIGKQPDNIIQKLIDLGHTVANHTEDHLPLTWIADEAVRYQLTRTQAILDPYQRNGLHLFRVPGFAYDSRVAAAISRDAYLHRLAGPFYADVGGYFMVGGKAMGGDWDCFARGYTPEACGALYVKDIQQKSGAHGVIVLLHNRTELMTGGDFAYRLVRYILEHLGPEYHFVPLDAIPGVRGDTWVSDPSSWTAEFGADDGQGAVVAGDLDGDKRWDACKGRGSTVYCVLSQGTNFSASMPWLTIGDPEWQSKYGAKFWLADINNDANGDLIFQTSAGIWVALSNGHDQFAQPSLWLANFSAPYLAFGDIDGDGHTDLVAWTDKGIVTAANNGRTMSNTPGFKTPVLYPGYLSPAEGWGHEQYGSTLRVRDINGDGFPDLVIRGAAHVFVLPGNGKSFGYPRSWTLSHGTGGDASRWVDSQAYKTFDVVKVNGATGFVVGAPTGIVYTPARNNTPTHWHLCNRCYSSLSEWRPARNASSILWGDFDGDGNPEPLFVRDSGLEVGVTHTSSAETEPRRPESGFSDVYNDPNIPNAKGSRPR